MIESHTTSPPSDLGIKIPTQENTFVHPHFLNRDAVPYQGPSSILSDSSNTVANNTVNDGQEGIDSSSLSIDCAGSAGLMGVKSRKNLILISEMQDLSGMCVQNVYRS